ncbi:MAG: sulfite exporter TauE/SafE family protein [Thermosynechococcaceae cyanobacterium]
MNIAQAAFLFLAAVCGGALNSVAGGGSFITLPALLFTGVRPVIANTTSTVALWPGSVTSAIAYRKDIKQSPAFLFGLSVLSLVGGILGALLLLITSDTLFIRLLPWLLLLATLVFTFGNTLTARFLSPDKTPTGQLPSSIALVLQFVIAIYGGYFGGGMGIMMLATYSLMGLTHIHAMNGLKSLLGAMINGVAVLSFILANAIAWGPGLVMVSGSMMGGYGGAVLAQRIDPKQVRQFVTVIAWGMTTYFFVKTYARF